jgi:anti-sigma B factor antagonist
VTLVRIADRENSHHAPEEPVPEQGLSVDAEERGSVFRIALRGELDVSTAPRFNAALSDPRVRRCRTVVIDLSELRFMDSTGLSALLVGEMHARTSGQRFTIVQGPRHVQELFRLTGVDHFLEVVESAPPE